MDIGSKELRKRLSEILDRVARGEKVVVRRRGKPAVALTAVRGKPGRLPDRAAARAKIRVLGRPMSEEVGIARDEERF